MSDGRIAGCCFRTLDASKISQRDSVVAVDLPSGPTDSSSVRQWHLSQTACLEALHPFAGNLCSSTPDIPYSLLEAALDDLSIVVGVLFITHAGANGPGLSKVRSTKHLPSGPSVYADPDWSRLIHLRNARTWEELSCPGLVFSSDRSESNEVGRFPIIAKSEQTIKLCACVQ